MKSKRQIVLDTETTGLKPENGHRIVEIGAVELIDNIKTGKTFQAYINPEMEMDEHVIKVHGITNEFLKDKPKFIDVADDFIKFITDSELVIHNADFDIKFLNKELNDINKGKIWDYIDNAICTLKLDRRLFAEEKKHKLDDICKRFDISTEHRTFHGALLDSELLAECFIKINNIYSANDIQADLEQTNWERPTIKRFSIELPKIVLTQEEEIAHENYLKSQFEDKKIIPVFKKQTTSNQTKLN
jgi:DNA polymerase-3 subunit epsilon